MFADIFVPVHELGKAITGEKVVVKIIDWPEGSNRPVGSIVDVLGMAGENEVEMHSILAEYGLPYKFDNNILNEAEKRKNHEIRHKRSESSPDPDLM